MPPLDEILHISFRVLATFLFALMLAAFILLWSSSVQLCVAYIAVKERDMHDLWRIVYER